MLKDKSTTIILALLLVTNVLGHYTLATLANEIKANPPQVTVTQPCSVVDDWFKRWEAKERADEKKRLDRFAREKGWIP